MADSAKYRCAACRQPLPILILLSGYVTHPTCDADWTTRERTAPIDESHRLGIVPCSQAHEALLILGKLAEVQQCLACAPKTYRI